MDAFDALVRNNLVNLFDYDKHLAAAINASISNNVAGNSSANNLAENAAVRFAMQICRIYLIDDRTTAQVRRFERTGNCVFMCRGGGCYLLC